MAKLIGVLSAFTLAGALLFAGNPYRQTSEYTIGPSVQPMVIVGEGWTQQFVFINVDYYTPEPTVGTVFFYTKDGQPWRIPLKGRGEVDHVDLNLKPGQMAMFETEVKWDPQVLGWAYFDLSDNVNEWGIYHSYTVYRKQTAGAPDLMTSVPFVDGLEDEWIVPFDNAAGKYPGVGIVNLSKYNRTTYHFDVYDIDGQLLKTLAKTVDPMHLEWFSLVHENVDLAGKRGQMKITGGLSNSAVLTLQFAPNAAFTALPVVHTYGM